MATLSQKLQYAIKCKNDIKEALIEKSVLQDTNVLGEYAELIKKHTFQNVILNPPSTGEWTQDQKDEWNAQFAHGTENVPSNGGSVDVTGLRYLNWDEDDIDFLQSHCPWSESENNAFIVSDFDKQCWDSIKATYLNNNEDTPISQSNWDAIMANDIYKYGIKFFPKINTSELITMSGQHGFTNWYVLYALPKLNSSLVTDMSFMFNYCHALSSVPKFDTSKVTDMNNMFSNCHSLVSVPKFDTSKVTDMNNMFSNCHSLTTIPLFDVSNVTNMCYMFRNCHSLIGIPTFDTPKIYNISGLFFSCYSLLFVPWFNTSNVVDMSYMFYDCHSIIHIPYFTTNNVANMYSMFNNCHALPEAPVINTTNVTNMGGMFQNCYSLTKIHDLNTSKVIYMDYIFDNCYSLTDISVGLKFANKIPNNIHCLSGDSVINLIKLANNTTNILQTIFLNYSAAKQIYEYSLSPTVSWMTANTGSQTAQTWLTAQASKTNKTNSTYSVVLLFADGSSDYSG